jgi:hypothetical protein
MPFSMLYITAKSLVGERIIRLILEGETVPPLPILLKTGSEIISGQAKPWGVGTGVFANTFKEAQSIVLLSSAREERMPELNTAASVKEAAKY